MAVRQALIIGAGPFGLSISAHLRQRGIDHQIVGRPVDTWRAHMPAGMYLKSEPYGSDFASPENGYDVSAYCKVHNLDYVHRLGPLSLERFLGYADWFTERWVPEVDDATVTEVTAVDGGFRVGFADVAPVSAQQVIVATGLLPYKHIPAELSDLPSDLITHTTDHHDLARFGGRRVAVLGSGQSALETAALLHETGADVTIIVRGPEVSWAAPNPADLSLVGHVRRPVNKLCEGWRCAVWNSPGAFRRLPRDMQVRKAKSVLGPIGAWWLKDRVDGVIETLTSHRIRGAALAGSGVRLLLDGAQAAIDVDHVIAGTGFRVDLARLPFLAESVQERIALRSRYPVVNRAGESSVPGLYFAGAHTAVSLGPSVRFIAGTHQAVAQLARSVARDAGQRGVHSSSVATPLSTHSAA
jgi:thioredoxin reductase